MNVDLTKPPRPGLHYLHVSHCTFVVSDGSAVLLIDPFFSGQFEWNGRTERHLDRPAVELEAISRVDAILVSHEHGDHYDPPTLRSLLAGRAAKVYAPAMVVDDAVSRHSLDARRFEKLDSGQQMQCGNMRVTVYPSAGSEKTQPVDRVGFHVESGGATIYHQGDSHGISPQWSAMRDRLDVFIMWPWRVLEVARNIRPRTIVFHHLDRFEPGDFFCNRSAELELTYHRHYHPAIEFVVPPLGQWIEVRSGR